MGWSPYNYTMNNPLNLTDPTGMAPEAPDHDYRLGKNGVITKTRNTTDNFDRIYNESGTDNITVDKSFLGNASSNEKGMIYSFDKNSAKYESVTERTFKFFADNTENEYGLNTFIDTKTGEASGFISTSFESGYERAGGIEMNKRMDNNPNLNVSRDMHSHPNGGKYTDSDYPSGFHPVEWKYSGTPGVKRYKEIRDDAYFYSRQKNKYGNRIPNNFEVYVPKAPTVKIKYNDKKAARTDNGIRY